MTAAGRYAASMPRAAFFVKPGFELREVPEPIVVASDVLVDVYGCGICGSDLHYHQGLEPVPRVCPGHEIAGRVAPGSPRLAPGLPVVIEPIVGCGGCRACRGGEPNLCPTLEILGRDRPGGFAERVAVPAASVYPIPPGLDLGAAVLAEPLAVAVHAVDLAAVGSGSEVLVIGGGTIGLLTAFEAARAGAAVTIVVRYPHQGAAAAHLGALRVMEAPSDAAVLAAVARRAPDVVFETVGGTAATMLLALDVVRPGGTIVMLGVFARPVTIDTQAWLAKEVRVVPSMMYRRRPAPDFVRALDLLRDDRARLAPLVTHRVPLGDIDRAFALASDKRSGAVKVVLEIDRAS